MEIELEPLAFRNQEREVTPVTSFARAEDVLEAMLQSIQGGELHLRPTLDPGEGSPFRDFLEIGIALRRCVEDRSRREYLIQRLKPHVNVIIGSLPASIQGHGLLPRPSPEHEQELRFRPLEDISDAEIRQWLIDDGGLIYGELKRYELDNYFDAISPFVRPGGTMYDLGSGLGKVVMSAALTLPFARCIGVEILAYRKRMAADRLHNMLAVRDRGLRSLPKQVQADTPLRLPSGSVTETRHLLDIGSRIEFVEKDMFDVDVSDASLVFIYSTCFGPILPALADKLAGELQEQTLVSTTTFPIRHPAFKPIKHFPSKTLAWTDVFFYECIGSSATLASSEAAPLFEPDKQEWEARVRQQFAVLDNQASPEGAKPG